MFIRTERLFLRPAWPEDWQELHAAIADERIVRNLSRVPWPYAPDDARAFVALPQDQRHPRFLITLPGEHGAPIIGGIGLSDQSEGAELGYWLTPEAWGRGFATEAARAVLALARMLGHERVSARHFLDNPASGRVLEKAGLRRTDRLVDVYSAGRAASFPAREYGLRFGAVCGRDQAPMSDPDFGMQAA